jgi:uncharacterized membrane protein
MSHTTCALTGQTVLACNTKRGYEIHEPLYSMVCKDHPGFNKDSVVSLDAINVYRKKHLTALVEEEFGELDMLEKEVVDAIAHNTLLSENIEDTLEQELSLGEKIADRIAEFGGSWSFINAFFLFIFIWMGVNAWMALGWSAGDAFDPYPFILLNLILSCIAAIQAPVIMMSQNRQEQKDRVRSEHDYKINLKAELEIKMLHEKIDHLMIHQNKRLLEIQQIQADYLEDILERTKK